MENKLLKKVALIGAGNMGSAILEGALKFDLFLPSQAWIYDKVEAKAKELARQTKSNVASSCREAVSQADVILLAIKPQDLAGFSQEVKESLAGEKCIVSILAGITIEKLKEHLGKSCSVVRAMPNLGAKVGQSISALAGDDEAALVDAELIFSGCGKTLRLDEKTFDVVTAVSGSGPAYFFYLMEHMIKAAEANGLSSEEAKLLVIQTAIGAANLAENSSETPAVLRERVTSKGGTTEAALDVLNQQAVDRIIIQAVEAARRRGEELRR